MVTFFVWSPFLSFSGPSESPPFNHMYETVLEAQNPRPPKRERTPRWHRVLILQPQDRRQALVHLAGRRAEFTGGPVCRWCVQAPMVEIYGIGPFKTALLELELERPRKCELLFIERDLSASHHPPPLLYQFFWNLLHRCGIGEPSAPPPKKVRGKTRGHMWQCQELRS